MGKPVDLNDLDRIDRFHRLGALADHLGEDLEQRELGLEADLLHREDVRRLVDRALTRRFDLEAHPRRLGAQLFGLRLAFGFAANRLAPVERGFLLGLGFDLDRDRIALGLLGCLDQLDLLAPLGDLALARGGDALLGFDRLGAGIVGLGLGLAFLAALVLDRDLLLLPGDLERALLIDPRLFHEAIGLDLLRIDLLFRFDPGGIGLAVAFGLLAGDLGDLAGAPHLDLAFLLEPGIFLIAGDLEALLAGFEVLGLDLHTRVLLDVVAQFLARLDLLGQLGQALGVEGVVRVEVLDAGLVEPGERDALELQSVHRQIVGGNLLHLLDEIGALFVQLVHGHPRRDRTQRIDELAFDQVLEHLGLHRALAQRLRRHRDRSAIRAHADVELRLHIDPQPIKRDQRLAIAPHHRQHQRVHVDRHRLVKHREDQRAAVHHDLFAAKAGPHKGGLLGGAAIERRQEYDDRDKRDKRDADIDGDGDELFHGLSLRTL